MINLMALLRAFLPPYGTNGEWVIFAHKGREKMTIAWTLRSADKKFYGVISRFKIRDEEKKEVVRK